MPGWRRRTVNLPLGLPPVIRGIVVCLSRCGRRAQLPAGSRQRRTSTTTCSVNFAFGRRIRASQRTDPPKKSWCAMRRPVQQRLGSRGRRRRKRRCAGEAASGTQCAARPQAPSAVLTCFIMQHANRQTAPRLPPTHSPFNVPMTAAPADHAAAPVAPFALQHSMSSPPSLGRSSMELVSLAQR